MSAIGIIVSPADINSSSPFWFGTITTGVKVVPVVDTYANRLLVGVTPEARDLDSVVGSVTEYDYQFTQTFSYVIPSLHRYQWIA